MLFRRKKKDSLDELMGMALNTIKEYREALNRSYKVNKELIEMLLNTIYIMEEAGYIKEAADMREVLPKLLKETEECIALTEAEL